MNKIEIEVENGSNINFTNCVVEDFSFDGPVENFVFTNCVIVESVEKFGDLEAAVNQVGLTDSEDAELALEILEGFTEEIKEALYGELPVENPYPIGSALYEIYELRWDRAKLDKITDVVDGV
jgi:hypothetical protein